MKKIIHHYDFLKTVLTNTEAAVKFKKELLIGENNWWKVQTKILKFDLISGAGGNLQIAEAVFQNNALHTYVFEKSGWFQRVLEHFSDLNDIKRIFSLHTNSLNQEFLLNYFK